MKLFKTIDEKLSNIGFTKLKEDKHGANYVREFKEYGYKQRLDFYYKVNGNHIVCSYEEATNSDGFNNSVGLTTTELKLAYKKLKQLSKKYKW